MTPLIWSPQNGVETARGCGFEYIVYKDGSFSLKGQFMSVPMGSKHYRSSDEIKDYLQSHHDAVLAEVEKARPKWIPVGEKEKLPKAGQSFVMGKWNPANSSWEVQIFYGALVHQDITYTSGWTHFYVLPDSLLLAPALPEVGYEQNAT